MQARIAQAWKYEKHEKYENDNDDTHAQNDTMKTNDVNNAKYGERSLDARSLARDLPVVSETDIMRTAVGARIVQSRRTAQDGGVLVDGVEYDTSPESMLALVTLLSFASRDPAYTAAVAKRNGGVQILGADAIHRVAAAATMHMQGCALWEHHARAAVDETETVADMQVVEEEAGTTVPSAIDGEPQPPEGTSAPPEFDRPAFRTVVCDELTTSKLYAADRRGCGSMRLDSWVGVKTENPAKMGSFMTLRSDRPPVSITVSCLCSSQTGLAGVLIYEPVRRVVLGTAGAPLPSSSTFAVPLQGVLQDASSDEVYEIEIHIANITRGGWIYLSNYHVTFA